VTLEEKVAEPVLMDGVTDFATPWTYCGAPFPEEQRSRTKSSTIKEVLSCVSDSIKVPFLLESAILFQKIAGLKKGTGVGCIAVLSLHPTSFQTNV